MNKLFEDKKMLAFPDDQEAPTTGRPQICFVTWGPMPDDLNVPLCVGQTGFHLANDGIAAHEVSIADFEIESGVWAKAAMIARIEEKGDGFAFVWRRDFPGFAIYTEKWNLLGSMAAAAAKKPASEIPQSEYRVKVSAIYRDSFNVWYRSQADLIYIPTQRCLTFGATTQERLGSHPEREALATLAGSPPAEADSPPHNRRGRPPEIDAARKEAALEARERKEPWKEVAKVLYATTNPTPKRVKNVSNILKNYEKKRIAPG
jgi:hypothetical protein